MGKYAPRFREQKMEQLQVSNNKRGVHTRPASPSAFDNTASCVLKYIQESEDRQTFFFWGGDGPLFRVA